VSASYCEGYGVELARNQGTGRLVIRAYNEGRNNLTDVDLSDLLEWLAKGPELSRTRTGFQLPDKE
jgi:hypothetical protein